MLKILLVEDSASDALLLQTTLDSRYPGQYVTTNAATLAEAKAPLARQAVDAVLLDLSLPDSQGLETIGRLAALAPNVPIVVLTGLADEKIAMEAVRSGAQDYLLKGQTDGAMIARAIRYAIDRKQTEETLLAQRQELEAKNKELQETQRRLETYRDRYVDLYDFAPLAYVTFDEDGYIQEINLAGAAMLGKDRAELTGYPLADHLQGQCRQTFLDHLRRCCNEGHEVTTELNLTTENGQSRTVRLRSICLKLPGEESTFCRTAITEIAKPSGH